MPIDHLVWVVPDLWEGIVACAERFGVRPVPGGSHPEWGTRNALLGLGSGCYLELIAPDGASSRKPTLFGMADLPIRSRLAAWALRVKDIDAVARGATSRGVQVGAISDGRRERTDGKTLSWRLTDPAALPAHGIVPFLIDWGGSEHPSVAAPSGCRLIDLVGEHPDPASIRPALDALGAGITVTRADGTALVARVRTPAGIVELRG